MRFSVITRHLVGVDVDMELPRVFANRNLKHAKIALVAAPVMAALFFVAGTDAGMRAFSQLGIRDSVAQTMSAAERTLQNTGDAVNSFIGRSPGERGATDVLKGKTKRVASRIGKGRDVTEPTQKALGKIFDKPVEGVASTATPQPVAGALPETVEFVAPVAGLPAFASVIPGVFTPVIGGGGGGSGGGGSGGGGGGGGGISVPPPVPPVVNAIPEPSTWALLLLGFAAVGASLRRTNANRLSLSRRAGHCAKV